MSEISLILVLQNKNKQNSECHGKSTNKIWETHSFLVFFSIMEQFDALLAQKHVLNIYSDNNAYANLFKTDFG